MSRFSTEFRANALVSEVFRSGKSILQEMGLIFQDRNEDRLVFREKQRFDPYNPARIEVSVRNNTTGSVVEVIGENMGFGPYQDSHVMRMIFEFIDRMEADLESSEEDEVEIAPHIAEELELLSGLHSKGVLSDHEFQKAKEKILG